MCNRYHVGAFGPWLRWPNAEKKQLDRAKGLRLVSVRSVAGAGTTASYFNFAIFILRK